MDAMSKKERLARGSAVIKVMKVIPRPGHYLKSYIDPRKLPKKPQAALKGVLADMPHLDVKNASFEFSPTSAKVAIPTMFMDVGGKELCDPSSEEKDPSKIGLPDGDKMLDYYGYRVWQDTVNPSANHNLAEHFNVMLGLLISMAIDKENESFPDTEAYPCVQFLKTVKTPDGLSPTNCRLLIGYIEYVAQKMLDEG